MIDDESRILRALKALLRDYTTFQTTNPLEAVTLAKQHDVDVVICDQRMPEKAGIEVLRDIKDAHPRAMRVLLTGLRPQGRARLGQRSEVYRFLSKPWNNTELKNLIEKPGISREAPVIGKTRYRQSEHDRARAQVACS